MPVDDPTSVDRPETAPDPPRGRRLPSFRTVAWRLRPPHLALGGGGARGFCHIGVLMELDRRGLSVRSITGTSMGAIVGGMYASLGSGSAVFDRWKEALDRKLIPAPPQHRRSRGRGTREHTILQTARRFRNRLVVSYALHQPSMLDGTSIDQAVDFLMPDIDIETLPIPFGAVATDLETAEALCLTSGSLRRAVRASGSIPGVLPPTTIDGRSLVDGGVVAEVPVEQARLRGRPVLAVDASVDLADRQDDDIALDTMMRTQSMTGARLRRHQLEGARWILRPEVGNAMWSDWDRFSELVEAGATAMRAWLDGRD